MAKLKLTKAAVERRKKDEQFRLESLKKKAEIQQKKELYGENWKQVEQQNLQSELEALMGNENVPHLYDFKDLYDFFDVIKFYKDRKNQVLKMDYVQFLDSEDQYREALQAVDADIEKANKAIRGKLTEDGISETDYPEPIVVTPDGKVVNGDLNELYHPEDAKKRQERLRKAGLVTDEETDSEGIEEDESLDKKESKNNSKKKEEYSEQAKQKTILNQIGSSYFNRYVPLYDKHVCSCCGRPLAINQFYPTYNLTSFDMVDERGTFHMPICKECCNKLFGYIYTKVAGKNVELAMQQVCAQLNLYWEVDAFYLVKDKYEVSGRKGTLLGNYIKFINENHCGKTFMESPFLVDEQYNSATRVVEINKNEAPFDWENEDARNKQQVIKMVGYDPFEYYNDEDKKILYRDLLNILDEGMENDLVKFQAGIQIVQSFFKIRQLNKKEFDMQQANADLSDLKAVADLRAKELAAISKFSSDNGFSERYATAKAKGENTFTGILKKMDEKKFENALLNRYDIETSETIQQAADASVKAIFKQLGMTESDVWKTCQEQMEELLKLRKENNRLAEEMRKTKVKLAEVNLRQKEKEYNASLGLDVGGDED